MSAARCEAHTGTRGLCAAAAPGTSFPGWSWHLELGSGSELRITFTPSSGGSADTAAGQVWGCVFCPEVMLASAHLLPRRRKGWLPQGSVYQCNRASVEPNKWEFPVAEHLSGSKWYQREDLHIFLRKRRQEAHAGGLRQAASARRESDKLMSWKSLNGGIITINSRRHWMRWILTSRSFLCLLLMALQVLFLCFLYFSAQSGQEFNMPRQVMEGFWKESEKWHKWAATTALLGQGVQLEVILNDKGFVFLVTTQTSWEESQDRRNLCFHRISG